MSTSNENPPSQSAPRRSGPLYFAGTAVSLLSVFGVVLLLVHRQSAEASEAQVRAAEVAKGPVVALAPVEVAEASRTVTLPGEVKAFQQANLYAKVSGYLKEIKVDKGDSVKANQLIAILESPDADQAVVAAEADLANKRAQAKRLRDLAGRGVSSEQDAENAEAAVKVAEATLDRARANRGYEEIRAPFAGVVTARYVDPGALLPAATGSTQSAQPVVEVSQMDELRIYVYLGQDDAAQVREGSPAVVTLDAEPGQEIQAQVTRMSHALDPRTRTMLCEVDLPNPDGHLLPGEFVHVRLTLPGQRSPRVPTGALISRSGKLFVAVIREGRAHLQEVTAGLDDGKNVQIVRGLQGGENVALNAGGDVQDGAPVQVAPAR